jgi:hypothetical protein
MNPIRALVCGILFGWFCITSAADLELGSVAPTFRLQDQNG